MVGNHRTGNSAKPGSTFADQTSMKHLDHRGPISLDNGHPGEQCRAKVYREDRACGRRKRNPHSRDDVVQFGNDDAENPEILEPCIRMYRVRTSSHQQQPRDFGGRRPSANEALGFVVEKALAAESGVPMMFEGVGRGTIVKVAQRISTDRASDAPSGKPAALDDIEIAAFGGAFLAMLNGCGGDPPASGRRNVHKSHPANDMRFARKDSREASNLIVRQIRVGGAQGARIRQTMAEHFERRDVVKSRMPTDP